MDVVRLAISKPVGVTVAVLLLVMFGLIGLTAIPIQLTPTVDRPVITVTTVWPGRSPQEVVDEITRKQEEQLKNVSNLRSMRSKSIEGQSEITLEFYVGSPMPRALQEVSDSLRQVSDYPDEVDEPRIKAADGASENAIAWIILDLSDEGAERHAGFDIATLFDYIDNEVKPFLERIDGVAEVNVYGGRQREVRVYVDDVALAQRGLNHGDVVLALRRENRNVSAGTIEEGKRDYRVRLVGQFETPAQILETMIAHRDGRTVLVKDVATVEIGNVKRRGFVRSLGKPSLAINVIRQSGANVVDVMADLRERLDEVREDILPNLPVESSAGRVGPDLRLRQVYDETVYIDSAIRLVTQNLWIGGSIAALVLLLFLRSFVSTGIVAIAIPVSVIGTFLVLLALGRTLNVVSLAGLAFAVGMVVDNAIVVLENIYRRIQLGEPPMHAAYNGGREVWGAILASTLTTVAVFIPVLTIQEEAGQLFRDISLAIVGAVALSLIVSILVIPAASSRWLRQRHPGEQHGRVRTLWETLFGLGPAMGRLRERIGVVMRWIMSGWRGWTVRPAIIGGLTGASILGALLLMPPLDYLPAGNRNLVFGGLLIPPGLSIQQQEDIAQRLESRIGPYARASVHDPESVAALAPIPRRDGSAFDPVPIDNFFIGAFGGGMFVGATSQKDEVVLPVGSLLTNAMMTVPDSYGGAQQTSIFGRGAGGGNTIDIEISGPSLDRVLAAAEFMFMQALQYFPGGALRPDPANFNVQQQEWRVRLTDHGRELGLRTEDLGVAVRALFDGAFVGDYLIEGRAVDIVVVPVGGRLEYKERLADVPVATPSGRIVPLDAVVEVVPGLAPQEIQRIEELPAVTIRVQPPEGEALESVMATIREGVVGPAREAGLLDRSMRVVLEGTAAKLDEVKASLFGPVSDETGTAARRFEAGMDAVSALILLAGIGGAVFVVVRAVRRRSLSMLYGAAGAIGIGLVLAALLTTIGSNPQFATARFIWALVVTYLLMCALFESFLHPLVIMFTVPLAVVGGFAGLKIVHLISLANPTKPPQQLDVLTMLGFIILVGVVVNNAILLVHQSLHFMRGAMHGEGRMEPMAPVDAISEAVKTRIRPIFMSVMTSVGGMMPLVLFPGAGSEMYRGLGSVVIGGLLVSTLFTLVLVPLLFSLVLDMAAGLKLAIRPQAPGRTPAQDPPPGDRQGGDRPVSKRALQPA